VLAQRARGTAVIDPTGLYRYSLTRTWEPASGRACFCLLNPSTADATRDDPTLRRCLGYARRWGFGSVEVVNIFALRATDPHELRRARDPIGPRNDAAIRRAARRAALVVAGWGAHGALLDRGDAVRAILARLADTDIVTLGLTKHAHPRHPLYARADAEPIPFPSVASSLPNS
jgi:hypothetical protein